MSKKDEMRKRLCTIFVNTEKIIRQLESIGFSVEGNTDRPTVGHYLYATQDCAFSGILEAVGLSEIYDTSTIMNILHNVMLLNGYSINSEIIEDYVEWACICYSEFCCLEFKQQKVNELIDTNAALQVLTFVMAACIASGVYKGKTKLFRLYNLVSKPDIALIAKILLPYFEEFREQLAILYGDKIDNALQTILDDYSFSLDVWAERCKEV